MKRLLGTLAFLALAACACGPTKYGPALKSADMGYREQRLEQERFRVTFRANPDLKGPQVEDMALRRAAELTTQNGYEWFTVVTRNTYLASGNYTPSGPTVGIGGSTGSYGSGLGIGLLLDLATTHGIDLSASWMVGDQDRDIACGTAAGVHTVLLRRAYNSGAGADHVLESLSQLIPAMNGDLRQTSS